MTRERGNQLIADGLADLVAFGETFIANPDLPARFAALAPIDDPTAPCTTHPVRMDTPTIRPTSRPAKPKAANKKREREKKKKKGWTNSLVPNRHWSRCAKSYRRSATATSTDQRPVATGTWMPSPIISSTPSPASVPPPVYRSCRQSAIRLLNASQHVTQPLLAGWRRRGLTGDVVFGGRTLPTRLALGILSLELVVHGWDFAVALHRYLEVSDTHVAYVVGLAQQTLTPQSRATTGFDSPVALPANADALDRLVAFPGRDPPQKGTPR